MSNNAAAFHGFTGPAFPILYDKDKQIWGSKYGFSRIAPDQADWIDVEPQTTTRNWESKITWVLPRVTPVLGELDLNIQLGPLKVKDAATGQFRDQQVSFTPYAEVGTGNWYKEFRSAVASNFNPWTVGNAELVPRQTFLRPRAGINQLEISHFVNDIARRMFSRIELVSGSRLIETIYPDAEELQDELGETSYMVREDFDRGRFDARDVDQAHVIGRWGSNILQVVLTDPGAGYVEPPSVTIVPLYNNTPNLAIPNHPGGDEDKALDLSNQNLEPGVEFTPAQAFAVLNPDGSVNRIQISDHGLGYANASVIISPPPAGGRQARAFAFNAEQWNPKHAGVGGSGSQATDIPLGKTTRREHSELTTQLIPRARIDQNLTLKLPFFWTKKVEDYLRMAHINRDIRIVAYTRPLRELLCIKHNPHKDSTELAGFDPSNFACEIKSMNLKMHCHYPLADELSRVSNYVTTKLFKEPQAVRDIQVTVPAQTALKKTIQLPFTKEMIELQVVVRDQKELDDGNRPSRYTSFLQVVDTLSLRINNVYRFRDLSGDFCSRRLLHKMHSRQPTSANIYILPFALSPEAENPTGSLDGAQAHTIELDITFKRSDTAQQYSVDVWCPSWNFLHYTPENDLEVALA